MLRDLTYKVVVIDDNRIFYEDYVEAAREYLEERGFLLSAEKQIDRLEQLGEINLREIDLFLVDLMLGSEDRINGRDFIKEIRENSLADILFYSSDGNAVREYKASRDFDMQKVYFTTRDENLGRIEEHMISLLGESIRRANTPIATRGLVLGCVAELDALVKRKEDELLRGFENTEKYEQISRKCARLYYDSYKSQQKKRNVFFGSKINGCTDTWEKISSEGFAVNISKLMNDINITDSSKNLRVLLTTYEEIVGKDENYQLLKKMRELLNVRNILAHVEQETKNGVYRFKMQEVDEYLELTDDKCKELRKRIVQAYKCLIEI